MDTLRTFIAIELPQAVTHRAGQLIDKLNVTSAKVKWVAPHNMHLTLQFLGDVDVRKIPDVCQAVQTAVEPLEPFELQCLGAGAFPNAHRPRTVWLGAGGGEERAVQLHDEIEAGLAKLGFRSERRRFTPHLTIGRVRHSASGIRELGELIEKNAQFDAGTFRVDEVLVISSRLERTGPVYEPLGRARLAGTG